MRWEWLSACSLLFLFFLLLLECFLLSLPEEPSLVLLLPPLEVLALLLPAAEAPCLPLRFPFLLFFLSPFLPLPLLECLASEEVVEEVSESTEEESLSLPLLSELLLSSSLLPPFLPPFFPPFLAFLFPLLLLPRLSSLLVLLLEL